MCHHRLMTHSSVTDRQRLLIPRAVHEQFQAIAERRGHIMSTMVWCWLGNAVRRAMAGQNLPLAYNVTSVLPRQGKELKWKQHPEEYQRWGQVLRDANSSPAAVIRAEITAYIASDGDVANVGEPLEGLVYA